MELSWPVCLIWITTILTTVHGQMTDEECLQNGFNRNSLKCSSCDVLEKFQLNKITDECQQCCVEDTISPESIGKTYRKARLEVCSCKFGALPQVEAFVKNEAKKFPNLVVRHVDGLWPIIKLIDDDGNVDQVLSISKWDTDTIVEFLSTYLVNY